MNTAKVITPSFNATTKPITPNIIDAIGLNIPMKATHYSPVINQHYKMR